MCHGSGKSSIIRRVDFAGRDHLLEADAIATQIYVSDPRLAAITAGREVLRRTEEYLRSGEISPSRPHCQEAGQRVS